MTAFQLEILEAMAAAIEVRFKLDSLQQQTLRAAIDERAELLAACAAILNRLDYLRNLWGDEGVTRSLCDQVRAAIAAAKDGS